VQREPWQFVLFGGIGDHVLWLSLLTSFRRRTTHPVEVHCDPSVADLARLYSGRAYDRLIEVEALDATEIARLREQRPFVPGTPLLAWHCNFVGDEVQYLAAQDLSIADLIRQLLRLPVVAPLDPPIWPSSVRKAADRHMRRLGLPVGRTILLAPWAKSAAAVMPMHWWAQVVRHFVDRGFVVACNVGNRARGFDRLGLDVDLAVLPHTVPIDIPLAELGPLAEQCGAVICVRSGLTDLLAFSKVRMCVVWPYDAARELYFRKLFAIWSVRRVYGSRSVVDLHPEASQPFDATTLPDWMAAE
jgi:hypothetical protein